jgi:hypothetical protein
LLILAFGNQLLAVSSFAIKIILNYLPLAESQEPIANSHKPFKYET